MRATVCGPVMVTPIADIEIVPLIGAAEICPGDEFLPRRQQVGADIPLVPDVAAGNQLLEPIPALAEKQSGPRRGS